MTTLDMDRTTAPPQNGVDVARTSTWFGVAYTACQAAVMIGMAILVLPKGGAPDTPALERGHRVLDFADRYTAGNYVFMISGVLLLGFLGAVQLRLRRVDSTGVLATVAVAAGTLLALIWPLAGVLHDVALDVGRSGADPRLLGAWDSIAPYSLAFSVLPRVFFLGALALGLRAERTAPWLQRTAVVLIVLSLFGSATLVTGAMFPFLALSTLGFELWVGALAWHWLRTDRD
jgi:cytochrome bd-type quinol oxidase subunit 2